MSTTSTFFRGGKVGELFGKAELDGGRGFESRYEALSDSLRMHIMM